MKEERTCQNCKQDFAIEPEDFDFYKKIDVPPPTWCPECRQVRRYAWRNERNLYRRNCDLCGKSSVTIYHPDSPYKVFCPSCWWSDKWSASDFAMDVDIRRPFFEQFKKIQLAVPRIALLTKNSIHSEYTNHSADNKDVYLSFDCFNCENGFYLSNCWDGTKNSCDINMIHKGGDLLYECTECDRSYKCEFCLLVHDSINCKYCYDCVNCHDCFLCFNQRNKGYCFMNEQFTKEEYEKRMRQYDFGSYAEREQLYSQWMYMIQTKAIHRYAQIFKSVNVSGSVIYNSKNIYHGFDIFDSENIRYSSIVIAKDSMDLYSVGLDGTQVIYESHAVVGASHNFFSHLSYGNVFIEYCDSCHDSQRLFGCVGTKKKDYCILNKQYTKEEYENIRSALISEMKKRGEYGEFFPPSLSPFGYNETHGDIYMPMIKDKALACGFQWQDNVLITKGRGTLSSENIPDNIKDVSNDIAKEALTCVLCSRNYNVISTEVDFYKQMNIPIPRYCPECRYRRRINLRPPRKLWHRKCMCNQQTTQNAQLTTGYKNTTIHEHGDKPCPNEFETSYAPERPEIVYCESCYQSEVI